MHQSVLSPYNQIHHAILTGPSITKIFHPKRLLWTHTVTLCNHLDLTEVAIS